jgi:hypothetical protein
MTPEDELKKIFPYESFDEAGYLRAYPDVAEALSSGLIKSGYLHFIANGLREGRTPSGLKSEPRNRGGGIGGRVFGFTQCRDDRCFEERRCFDHRLAR